MSKVSYSAMASRLTFPTRPKTSRTPSPSLSKRSRLSSNSTTAPRRLGSHLHRDRLPPLFPEGAGRAPFRLELAVAEVALSSRPLSRFHARTESSPSLIADPLLECFRCPRCGSLRGLQIRIWYPRLVFAPIRYMVGGTPGGLHPSPFLAPLLASPESAEPSKS